MINEKMEQAINGQINAEIYSGYLYLSMSAWAQTQGLPGFANWFRIQAQEEGTHGMKMFDYVVERGGHPLLTAVDAPQTQWQSSMDVFEAVLAHEQKVTGLINDLMDLSIELRDHASRSFLGWFVDEQVEEEAGVEDILAKLRLVGDGHGLFQMDKDLSARVFVPPAP
jgi:ferritin